LFLSAEKKLISLYLPSAAVAMDTSAATDKVEQLLSASAITLRNGGTSLAVARRPASRVYQQQQQQQQEQHHYISSLQTVLHHCRKVTSILSSI